MDDGCIALFFYCIIYHVASYIMSKRNNAYSMMLVSKQMRDKLTSSRNKMMIECQCFFVDSISIQYCSIRPKESSKTMALQCKSLIVFLDGLLFGVLLAVTDRWFGLN